MEKKIAKLQGILNETVLSFDRWRKVSVTLFADTPKDVKEKTIMQPDEFCIKWNGRRRNGIHDEEFRTIPNRCIDEVIARYQRRLREHRAVYR